VENPETAEMSRLDSPDPVMYDLMRKSIQATMMLSNDDNDCNKACNQHLISLTSSSNGTALKAGKRRLVGQSHLLYKNNPNKTSSVVASSTASLSTTTKMNNNEKLSHCHGMESRSATTNNTTAVKENTVHSSNTFNGDSPSSPSSPSTFVDNNNDAAAAAAAAAVTTKDTNNNNTLPKFPTRLLIRRRSLRVVEEGGGTHIYAIRYPEDNNQMFLAEQATPLSTVVRQEQCPPRKGELTSFNHLLYSSGPSPPTVLTKTDGTDDSTDDAHRAGKGDASRKKSQTTSTPSFTNIDNNKSSNNNTKPIQPGDDDDDDTSKQSKPTSSSSSTVVNSTTTTTTTTTQQQPGPEDIAGIFSAETMASPPKQGGT
jgi:hypothetical protein